MTRVISIGVNGVSLVLLNKHSDPSFFYILFETDVFKEYLGKV